MASPKEIFRGVIQHLKRSREENGRKKSNKQRVVNIIKTAESILRLRKGEAITESDGERITAA